MTRPRCDCKIKFTPPCTVFEPAMKGGAAGGIALLTPEELESLRLKNVKGLDQTTAAAQMGISQSSFQRLLASAHKKVSEAIVFGKTIKITGDQ